MKRIPWWLVFWSMALLACFVLHWAFPSAVIGVIVYREAEKFHYHRRRGTSLGYTIHPAKEFLDHRIDPNP